MKPDDSKQNDDALHHALAEWRVTAPVPPRFRERVWRRIETARAHPSAWAVWRDWFERVFARPAVGFSYAVVLVSVGLALGFRQAHHRTARLESELSARYVQSVDPYQTTRP